MAEFDIADAVGQQAKANAVFTSAGKFEEHPEAYRPRIFCQTEHGGGKVYELLQDGQAVIWPKAPDPDVVGFDFWLVDIDRLKDIEMRRRTNG